MKEIKELSEVEIRQINGGIVPILIGVGKAFATGFTLGGGAYALYFGVRGAAGQD